MDRLETFCRICNILLLSFLASNACLLNIEYDKEYKKTAGLFT